MKARIFIGGGIAALAVLALSWFVSTYERVPAKEWVGPAGEARIREFLAAERFAERMGWEVAEVRSLPALEALRADGVLLLPNRRQALDARRMADMLRWVEAGGHLIAEAESLGVPDPLFDLLGVLRLPAQRVREPFAAELPQGAGRLSVVMDHPTRLEASQANARLRIGPANNLKLASLPRGRGMVTVASSLDFARNPKGEDHVFAPPRPPGRSIGAQDHAELLWHLLALTGGRELQVYFRPERLSLWGFLKEHAAPALAAGVLLLVLWLWRIAPRFGPVAPDAAPARRRLLDHLRASGRYYWAKGLRARLVLAARDAALHRLARAQPDFAAAAPAERAARLASFIKIPKDDAARFIAAGGAARGADLIRLTQHAQRIHSALEKGDK